MKKFIFARNNIQFVVGRKVFDNPFGKREITQHR